jgi:hypothetical protein
VHYIRYVFLIYGYSHIHDSFNLIVGTQVQKNQTCGDILANATFSITELKSWNPIIHTNCDNLDTLAGRSICVS